MPRSQLKMIRQVRHNIQTIESKISMRAYLGCRWVHKPQPRNRKFPQRLGDAHNCIWSDARKRDWADMICAHQTEKVDIIGYVHMKKAWVVVCSKRKKFASITFGWSGQALHDSLLLFTNFHNSRVRLTLDFLMVVASLLLHRTSVVTMHLRKRWADKVV